MECDVTLHTKKAPCPKETRYDRVKVASINTAIKDEFLEFFNELVFRVNDIFTVTAQFIKLYLLSEFELLGAIDQNLHEKAKVFSSKFSLKSDLFSQSFTACTSEKNNKRGPPFKKGSSILELYDAYDRFRGEGFLPETKYSGQNMSHIIQYLETQLRTAYLNNIRLHYPKYVKRVVRIEMKRNFLKDREEDCWEDIPCDIREQFNGSINRSIKIILSGDTTDDSEFTIKIRSKYNLVEGWEALLTDKPHLYLPYMIYINKELESFRAKLYSPVPFRSEFIPKHAIIDTTALVDAYFVDDRKEKFPKFLDHMRSHGWVIEANFRKDQIYKDQSKRENIAEDISINEKAARFKSDIWKYFTRSSVHKTFCGFTFNNMITTNGYKVSISYVDPVTYIRESFKKGVNVVNEKRADDFSYTHKLDNHTRIDMLQNEVTRIACDPGKGNICTFVGEKGKWYKQLTYKASERRTDMFSNRNKIETDKSLLQEVEPGKTYKDLLGNLTSKGKSSSKDEFGRYLIERARIAGLMKKLYERKCFRRRQYRSYIGKRSSEDRLVSKIGKTFNPGENPTQQLVIMWGNWGRNPNMKHQPPTPGMGLRRKVHKVYQTFTCDERGTSSVCVCGSEVEKPVIRSNWIESSGVVKERKERVHHVLRCKNASCRIWWQRDVLGATNIGRQSLYCLQNGVLDRTFTSVRRKHSTIDPDNSGSKSSTSPIQHATLSHSRLDAV